MIKVRVRPFISGNRLFSAHCGTRPWHSQRWREIDQEDVSFISRDDSSPLKDYFCLLLFWSPHSITIVFDLKYWHGLHWFLVFLWPIPVIFSLCYGQYHAHAINTLIDAIYLLVHQVIKSVENSRPQLSSQTRFSVINIQFIPNNFVPMINEHFA